MLTVHNDELPLASELQNFVRWQLILNKSLGAQKTLTLSSPMKLEPEIVRFAEITDRLHDFQREI
jgi:hypothetical protein